MVMDVENKEYISDTEANQRMIREMVRKGYQEMLDGKGRDYKEFFAELESKYRNADI